MFSRSLQRLASFLSAILLFSLVIAALLSLAGRLLMANIDYFRGDIEQELNAMGISGFALDGISGHWNGLKPVLKLRGASLSVPGRSRSLHIDQLELSVKFLDSLAQRDLKIGAIRASVSRLILVKDGEGRWWLNDIALGAGQGQSGRFDFYAMFERLPDYVAIDMGLIQIRDASANQDFLIQNSQVLSHLSGDRLDIRFHSDLPHSLGRRLEVLFSGDQRHQKLHVFADDLNPDRLLTLAGFPVVQILDTRLSLESWARLEDMSLQSVTTRVQQASLKLQNGHKTSDTLRFSVDQKLRRTGEAWRADTHLKRIFYRGRELPALFSSVHLSAAESGPVLAVDRLELGGFMPLLADLVDDGPLHEWVSQAAPSVNIFNLVARIERDQPSRSALGFEFEDLTSQAHANLPGIERLSGQFSAANGRFSLHLPQQPLALGFKTLFRQPLVADDFSATVNGTLAGRDILLSVEDILLNNPDISAEGRAWFEIQPGQTPFMSLRLTYRDGQAQTTGKYLPVSIMPKATVRWLDNSIKGGSIPRGGLLYHGRLRSLDRLEKEQSGVFHALFDLHEPEVDYLAGWPVARHGKGQASFYNMSMHLAFDQVGFASSVVNHVDISIADFSHSLLVIDGNSQGAAASVLDTLASLPVVEAFDQIKANYRKASGQIDSHILLEIPLHPASKRDIALTADARLHDVELQIPQWAVDFSQVNGLLSVKDTQVSARGLSVRYAGDPARLDVTTNRKAGTTDFVLKGELSTRHLLRLAPDFVSEPVSGKSPWDLRVSLTNEPRRDRNRLEIKASSSLQGTAIDAPKPVLLARNDAPGFTFDAQLDYANDFVFVADLQKRVKASGRLADGPGDAYALDYLDLRFGDDTHKLKDNGVNLSGKTEFVNIDRWLDYVKRFQSGEVNTVGMLHSIKSVDLDVDELRWQGRPVHKLSLEVSNRGDRLTGELESSALRGVFTLPFEMSSKKPFKGDFDYIRLRKNTSKVERAKPSLADMPSLDIKSKLFAYEDMVFSDFVLRTSNEPDRFVINRLDFRRDDVVLDSSGHWQYSKEINRHVTVFNIKVKGRQFGAAISNLGLGDSIRNGVVDFEGQIGWGGSLFDINWPTLIGEVSLSLKDGYLNNVEPGAGRFVGLLSLNALPRRLFLNFGDVLSEGMQFDEIRGNFTIKGELMSTEDATMDGASARVELFGDTNLRHKTYNQHMVIVPKIGETLPVLGSLAAGNAVGWGLLLIQKIFKKPIEKSVQIDYDITGSWDDPTLTLISKVDPESSEFESDNLNDF